MRILKHGKKQGAVKNRIYSIKSDSLFTKDLVLKNQIRMLSISVKELKKLTEDINSAKKEQIEKNMSTEIFTIYWILKKEGFTKAEELANKMQDVLSNNPYWYKSDKQERTVRQKLYQVLITSGEVEVEKVSSIASKIIDTLKRSVKNDFT